MELLPYVELPLYEDDSYVIDYAETLNELDNALLDVCHLLKVDSKYYFQIGFYLKGSVFTSRKRIIDVHDEFLSSMVELPWSIVEELRVHIGYYCNIIKYLPAWGEEEYYTLVAQGKTPRRLDGPHKTGLLGRAESRYVTFRPDRSLSFGPKLSYISSIEKSEKVETIKLR